MATRDEVVERGACEVARYRCAPSRAPCASNCGCVKITELCYDVLQPGDKIGEKCVIWKLGEVFDRVEIARQAAEEMREAIIKRIVELIARRSEPIEAGYIIDAIRAHPLPGETSKEDPPQPKEGLV